MTLDDLLKLAKAPRRVEAVKVGDATIHVRGLSAADVQAAAELADETKRSPRCCVMAYALCDENGVPLCGDPAKHLDLLDDLPATLVRRLDVAIDRASDVPAGATSVLAGESGTPTGVGS